jgi:hypothetical protein
MQRSNEVPSMPMVRQVRQAAGPGIPGHKQPQGYLFSGTGSTGVAALAQGFRFLGVEQEHPPVVVARTRLEATVTAAPQQTIRLDRPAPPEKPRPAPRPAPRATQRADQVTLDLFAEVAA